MVGYIELNIILHVLLYKVNISYMYFSIRLKGFWGFMEFCYVHIYTMHVHLHVCMFIYTYACSCCFCCLQQNTREEEKLIEACKEGDLETVKSFTQVILQDVRDHSWFGYSLLHYAARLVMEY